MFEKYDKPGGMLSWAIPAYRLPRETLYREISNILRAGIDLECGVTLGKDFSLPALLEDRGFNAVVLAIGAHRSRSLGIPGDDKTGVVQGLDFLRQIVPDYAGPRTFDVAKKRVGIIGGGDVAIDVARSSLRLGASQVHVLYRRAGEHMPAAHLPEEIEAAMQEGVQFHTLVNPIEVLGDDHVTGVLVQRQRLAEFDNSGRRRPVGIQTEIYTLHLDLLIPAVGQTPDLSCLEEKAMATTQNATLVVGDALNTTHAGVFAAGDAVLGPSTIIQAVAQGNLVAAAVDHWLATGQFVKPRYQTPRHDVALMHDLNGYASAHRPTTCKLNLHNRLDNFNEVELGLDERAACEEAKRCLRCDLEWLDAMHIARPALQPAAKVEVGP